MKSVRYSKLALRVLQRMPANTARTIRAKIEQYAADPASLANNLRPLKGDEFKGYTRLRVGDWWVIMRDDGAVVDIAEIGPRSDIYD
ncbi:type II toxin-antitoxin system RelE family toxin [Inquilinus sp. OTU3971]|uniref:type II toxin-antitoxin system RelE family toxin n=1 Tax=Inquilinus sp. OTU3971 TaxID=3043855 RepID=UPI00313BE0DF